MEAAKAASATTDQGRTTPPNSVGWAKGAVVGPNQTGQFDTTKDKSPSELAEENAKESVDSHELAECEHRKERRYESGEVNVLQNYGFRYGEDTPNRGIINRMVLCSVFCQLTLTNWQNASTGRNGGTRTLRLWSISKRGGEPPAAYCNEENG